MIWVILGIVIGIVLYHVASRARAGKLKVRWYQWVLGVLATCLLLLAVQNYLALQAELEPAAAGLALGLFGLPAAVLVALIWAIPALVGLACRKRAPAPSAMAKTT